MNMEVNEKIMQFLDEKEISVKEMEAGILKMIKSIKKSDMLQYVEEHGSHLFNIAVKKNFKNVIELLLKKV